MEVILSDDMEKLGKIGEQVRVKDGYARNYLIPRGLAVPVSSRKGHKIEHQKKIIEDRRRKEVKTAASVAQALSEISVEIPVQVGEEDRIFGSVTHANIADAIAAKGFSVDRRKIELEEPIKALGVYTIRVHLGPEIVATPKVWVVKAQKQEAS